MKQFFIYYLIIAVPLSLIAGLVAGLIVYEEFRHHFVDKNKAIRPAIETGVIAFLFFFITVFFTVFFLLRM
jgi:hypothetical protein